MPDAQRLAADMRRADGEQRFAWKIWDPMQSTVPMYRQVMTRAIAERMRWKAQYEAAKALQGASSVAGMDVGGGDHPEKPP